MYRNSKQTQNIHKKFLNYLLLIICVAVSGMKTIYW